MLEDEPFKKQSVLRATAGREVGIGEPFTAFYRNAPVLGLMGDVVFALSSRGAWSPQAEAPRRHAYGALRVRAEAAWIKCRLLPMLATSRAV
jgi:hypothetical protein